MQKTPIFLLLLVGIVGLARPSSDPSVTKLGEVQFAGPILGENDISGAAVVGDLLAIVSDEVKDPTKVQILKKDGAGYKVMGEGVTLPVGEHEMDMEAAAADGNLVYVTGSHARTRKIENGMIEEVKRKKSREQIFRFQLKPDGTAGPVQGPKSLTAALEADPVLSTFRDIASKENGIDIEGLAVKNGVLYFGFRGPVLRGGWVPVLSCKWHDIEGTAKVQYIRLDGRGIRDIVAVDGGFLVLAGPVGEGDFSYRIYFWDGVNQLPAGENGPKPQLLGELPNMSPGKPEGLAVLNAQGTTYEVLLLCDGLPKGGPTRWRVTRP